MSDQRKPRLQFSLKSRKKLTKFVLFSLCFLLVLVQIKSSHAAESEVVVPQVPVPVVSLPEFLHRRGVDILETEPEAEAESFFKNGDNNKPATNVSINGVEVDAKDYNETFSNSTIHKDPLRVEEILRQIFGADMEEENEEDLEQEFFGHIRVHDDHDPMMMDESKVIEAGNETLSRSSRSESTRRRGGNNRDREENDRPGKKNAGGQRRRGPNQGQGRPKGKGKGIDLTKYNAYMDAVLSRMNTLIRKKRMDPLRVNLYAGPSKAAAAGGTSGGGPNKAKKKNNRNKNGKQGNGKKGGSRAEEEEGQGQVPPEESASAEDQDEEDEESRALHRTEDANDFSVRDVMLGEDVGLGRRTRRDVLSNSTETKSIDEEIPDPADDQERASEAAKPASKTEEGRKTGNKKPKVTPTNKASDAAAVKNGKGGATGGKKKNNKESSDSDSESAESESAEIYPPPTPKKKPGNKDKNSPRPTRGILHGLSTLRREGNVNVIKDGDRARIVRAKFLLGPVALEILPKKSRKGGVSREEQSATNPSKPVPSAAATATAPQLRGILEIRLSPRSPTRIRKLRVFPPGNVQVDGENQKSSGQPSAGPGYRKVTPMATARLRQAAVQVVRQVDSKLRPRI